MVGGANHSHPAVHASSAATLTPNVPVAIGNPFRIEQITIANYPGRRCAGPGLCSETPSAYWSRRPVGDGRQVLLALRWQPRMDQTSPFWLRVGKIVALWHGSRKCGRGGSCSDCCSRKVAHREQNVYKLLGKAQALCETAPAPCRPASPFAGRRWNERGLANWNRSSRAIVPPLSCQGTGRITLAAALVRQRRDL